VIINPDVTDIMLQSQLYLMETKGMSSA